MEALKDCTLPLNVNSSLELNSLILLSNLIFIESSRSAWIVTSITGLATAKRESLVIGERVARRLVNTILAWGPLFSSFFSYSTLPCQKTTDFMLNGNGTLWRSVAGSAL